MTEEEAFQRNCVILKEIQRENISKKLTQHEEILLNDLEGSTIVLTGISSKAIIKNCNFTRVFLAPCRGNISIQGCENCTFTIACNTVDVTNCTDCTFYIYSSSPISLSASVDLRIGPFNGFYQGIVEDFVLANLDSKNYWNDVQCFDEEEPLHCYSFLSDEIDGRVREFSELRKEKLREAFHVFDQDKDGKLSLAEFNELLKSVNSSEVIVNEEQLRSLLKAFGIKLTKDGKITLNNFILLYIAQGAEEIDCDLDLLGLCPCKLSIWKVSSHSTIESLSDSPSFNEYSLSSARRNKPTNSAIGNPHEQSIIGINSDTPPIFPITSSFSDFNLIQSQVQERLKKFQKQYDNLVNLQPEVILDKKDNSEVNNLRIESSTATEFEEKKIVPMEVNQILKAAEGRGIDIFQWFRYFDDKKTNILSRETFERAFTGIGLGLGFGMGQLNQLPIERAIHVDTMNFMLSEFGNIKENSINYKYLLEKAGIIQSWTENDDSSSKMTQKTSGIPFKENMNDSASYYYNYSKYKRKTCSSQRIRKDKTSKVKVAPFSVDEFINDLKSVFKAKYEKYLILIKELGLTNLNELTRKTEENILVPATAIQTSFKGIGICLSIDNVKDLIHYIDCGTWKLKKPLQETKSNETFSCVGDTSSISKAKFRSFLLFVYPHSIPYKEWRRKKKKMVKNYEKSRIEMFQKSLAGEKHDLSEKEIRFFLKSIFQIDTSLLEMEALAQAKQWIDNGSGRTLVLRKITKVPNLSEHEIRQLKRKELYAQKEKILSSESKRIDLLYRLFMLYSKDCVENCPSPFDAWLEKRLQTQRESGKVIKRWIREKKLQKKIAKKWYQDKAPTQAIQKQLTQVLSSAGESVAKGLTINRTLRKMLAESSRVSDESDGDILEDDNLWWERLSSKKDIKSIDGIGTMLSRQSCIEIFDNILIPLSTKSCSAKKNLLSDPVLVSQSLEKQMDTNPKYETTKIELLAKHPDKSDKQIEKMAKDAVACEMLRGDLFVPKENENEIQTKIQCEYRNKRDNVRKEVKEWYNSKMQNNQKLKKKTQKHSLETKKSARKKKELGKKAYERWLQADKDGSYFSYSKQQFQQRPPPLQKFQFDDDDAEMPSQNDSLRETEVGTTPAKKKKWIGVLDTSVS